MRVVIWGLSVLATIWAWGCQSSTSSGTSWSWLDRGRISRSIQSGTTSTIEEAKIVARKGDTIEVTYEVAVRRGSIQIEVWRPLTPWGRPSRFGGVTLNETRRGTFVVSVDELFTYDIWIKPVWFGGTYDVSWRLRAARANIQ